jgi:hypothetical protein
MEGHHPDRSSAFSSADFPALREFLRGYFHQDWQDEHGSVEAAAHQFRQDADREQRQNVAEQWQVFRRQTTDLPLERIRELLIGLGSAWSPASIDELEIVTRVLAE